jgi:hypothetical protein
VSEIEGLRELADVDPPDLVRGALRRFRRRVFARTAWTVVALVAAIFIVVFVYEQARPPLSRLGIPTDVYDAQALQVGRAEVVFLHGDYFGDYVALHFVGVHPGVEHACVQLTIGPYTPVRRAGSDGEGACGGGVGEHWFYIPRPVRGKLNFTVSDGGERLGAFVLLVPAPPRQTILMEASDGG